MFEQSFIAPGASRRDRNIALAVVLQGAAVAGLILMPLTAIEPLGAVRRLALLPPAVLKKEPPPVRTEAPKERLHTQTERMLAAFVKPVFTVSHLAMPELAEAPAIAIANVPSGDGRGDALTTMGVPAVVAEPPARSPQKAPRAPVQLTSKVSLSQLIYGPKPAYPKLALMARVEGTVHLQAVIGRTGEIENLHALSGPALLIAAAMDTVRAWRYRPLLLNGEPVEVITEIDVTFTLRQ